MVNDLFILHTANQSSDWFLGPIPKILMLIYRQIYACFFYLKITEAGYLTLDSTLSSLPLECSVLVGQVMFQNKYGPGALSVKVPLQLIWTPSLWRHLYMRSVFILITAAHFCVCQVSIMLAKTGLGSNAISAMEWSNRNKKQGNCILVWKMNMIGLQTHSERKQWLLTGLLYFKTKNNIISVCTHTTSHWSQVKPNTQVWIFKEHTCSYWSYWYFFPLLLFGIEVIQK